LFPVANPVAHKRYYTPKEFFQAEEWAEARHEYWRGEILAMAGTTKSHNACVGNLYVALRVHFTPRHCDVFTENILLEVIPDQYYTYPDLTVSCSDRDREDNKLVREPALIVEVLSKSTQGYDLSTKLTHYLNIPGLLAYVVVSRREHALHVWEKAGDGWQYRTLQGLDNHLFLPAFGLNVPFADIYRNVALET
jgi:Uma2 family endonuclease